MDALIRRADDYWFASWRAVVRDALDVIRTADTASPTRLAIAMADRVMIARGRFVRRDRVPAAFYAVVAAHALCVGALLAYPFVARSRDLDGWFFVVLGLVYLHWLVCYGECVLGWAEKKLYYREYALGDAPLHCWFMDALSLPALVAFMCAFVAVSVAGVALVVLRNVRFSRGEAGFTLRFAGPTPSPPRPGR